MGIQETTNSLEFEQGQALAIHLEVPRRVKSGIFAISCGPERHSVEIEQLHRWERYISTFLMFQSFTVLAHQIYLGWKTTNTIKI